MSHAYSRAANLLGALIQGLSDEIEHAAHAAAGQGGQAPAALVQMAGYPGQTIEELRIRVGLTHSAVVRLLDRLVERGLVERARGRDDARVVRLALTEEGRRVAAAVLDARAGVLERVLASLPEESRTRLESILDDVLPGLPATSAQSSQMCRMCELRACPADRCPVEARYQELTAQGR